MKYRKFVDVNDDYKRTSDILLNVVSMKLTNNFIDSKYIQKFQYGESDIKFWPWPLIGK